MLSFLPAPLLGVVIMAFLILNTLFWASLVYLAVFVKLLLPRGSQAFALASRLAAWQAQNWAQMNVWACDSAFRWDWTASCGSSW